MSSSIPAHVQRIFTDAAQTIKKRGWQQGSKTGPKGEVCLLEAVERACNPGEFYDAYDVLLGEVGRPDKWNDAKYRQKHEVTGLLRRLAG